MQPRKFNYTRFTSVNPEESGRAAMKVIDRLQHFPPEVQVAGLCVAFLTLIRQYDPKELSYTAALTVANNLLDQAAASVPALRAVQHFIQFETK
jgi:hypothetical protein